MMREFLDVALPVVAIMAGVLALAFGVAYLATKAEERRRELFFECMASGAGQALCYDFVMSGRVPPDPSMWEQK